jgi:hypothetical protein
MTLTTAAWLCAAVIALCLTALLGGVWFARSVGLVLSVSHINAEA